MADTVILYSFLFERGAHSRFIDQNYNLIWSYVWYPTIYKTIPKCITYDKCRDLCCSGSNDLSRINFDFKGYKSK